MLLTAERLVRNNNLLNTAQYTTIHHATVIPPPHLLFFPVQQCLLWLSSTQLELELRRSNPTIAKNRTTLYSPLPNRPQIYSPRRYLLR